MPDTPHILDTTDQIDLSRRFGGVARIYGDTGFARLNAAHIVVVGIGGVGSWALECLARSGVGRLTLIDQDVIAESNINRQLHSLGSTLGQDKTQAMRDRIAQINPQCHVQIIDDWLTVDNIAALLPADATAVLDCIDQVRPKAALAAYCVAQGLPLVVCGAAGGKQRATALTTADLSQVSHDPLLAKLRQLLRHDYGFAKGTVNAKQKTPPTMGVRCVYSTEAVKNPWAHHDDIRGDAAPETQGLNCTGYGSLMHITATMGLMAAGELLSLLAANPR